MMKRIVHTATMIALVAALAVEAQSPDVFNEPDTQSPSLRLERWPTADLSTGGQRQCLAAGGTKTLQGWAVDHVIRGEGKVALEVQVERSFGQENVKRTYRPAVDPMNGKWSVEGIEIGDVDASLSIHVIATDEAGNQERRGFSYEIDGEPPSLKLEGTNGEQTPGLTPPPNAPPPPLLGDPPYFLNAVVHDNPRMQRPRPIITLDGKPYDRWDHREITDGIHVFAATVTDCAGHTVSAHWRFALDNTPPRLLSTSPSEGETTAKCRISGTADSELAEVTVDGKPAVVNGRSFTLEKPKCHRQGKNTFDIRLTDMLENTSKHERTINFQPFDPRVDLSVRLHRSIVNSISDGKVFTKPFRPWGDCSDETATVTMKVNGKSFEPETLIAVNGRYVLEATCRDGLGRTSTVQTNVELAWEDDEERR